MNKKSLVLIPAVLLLLSACGNGGKTSGTTSETHDTTTSEVETVAVTGITLNKTEATLEIGENVTLTASVTPTNATNKSVTWSVDHPEVATVEKGRVTAIAAGTATVTATSVDGGFTALCTITVNGAKNYGSEETPLTADEAYALCQTVDAGGYTEEVVWAEGIIYTSSWYASGKTVNGYFQTTNKDYGVQLYGVTVSDEVKGSLDLTKEDVLVGYKAVICGYMQNYNNTNFEFTKRTVGEDTIVPEIKLLTAPTEAATGVKIISNAPTIDEGSSVTLKARLTPLHSVGTITWEVANTAVATIDANGKLTGVAQGSTTVVAKVGEIVSEALDVTVNPAPYVMKCNFANKEASNTSYSGTWDYNDKWSVTGGANNGAGWAFVKLGKKSVTDLDSSIQTKVAATEAVASVTIKLVSGSLSKDDMKLNSYGVRAYSDATLETKIGEVIGTEEITNSAGEFTLTPTTAFPANTYYQVFFNITNGATANGVICVESVTLNR